MIRFRTNYRIGEEVYLYRTVASPRQVRERFLEYLATLNRLHLHPEWYNVLTTNCTTTIRNQYPARQRIPWDWRLLLNGKADDAPASGLDLTFLLARTGHKFHSAFVDVATPTALAHPRDNGGKDRF